MDAYTTISLVLLLLFIPILGGASIVPTWLRPQNFKTPLPARVLKSTSVFFLITLAGLSSVYAVDNYTEIGFTKGDFDSTSIDGFFNANIDAVEVANTIRNKGLSSSIGTPLVKDLDNDGTKEIIVLDAGTINALSFSSSTGFDTQDTLSIGGSRYSNMVLYDIDNDGLDEIIIVEDSSGTINIVNFSNSDLQLQNSFSDPNLGSDSESQIKCVANETCFIAWSDNYDIPAVGFPEVTSIFTAKFSSTGVQDKITVDAGASSLRTFCAPKLRQVQYKNADTDGDTEFVFSFMDVGSSSPVDESVTIWYVSEMANGSLQEDAQKQIDDIGDILTDDTDCVTAQIGNLFTSPLVKDTGDGGSFETWLASNVDADNYRMYKLEEASNGLDCNNLLDFDCSRYPDVLQADGVIISNIFSSTVFGGDTDPEFCVLGQDTGSCPHEFTNCLNVICSSEESTQNAGDSVEYIFDGYQEEFNYNISQSPQDFHMSTHFIDVVGGGADEILTSFGTFDLSETSCSTCDLNLLWTNELKTSGVSIPVDYTDSGNFDILHMTRNSINYIDDLFENTAPTAFCSVNPCMDSIIKINSTIQVVCDIDDPDDDSINITAKLYEGESNEQITNVPFRSEASDITFTFDGGFNKTTGTSSLEIFVQDIEGNSNTITNTFAVSSNGVEFGDCSSTFGDVPTPEEVTDEEVSALGESQDAANNVGITTNLVEFSNLAGVSPLMLWLFIMFITGMAIILTMGTSGFGILAVVETFLLIMGFIVGAINIGIIVIISIIALAVLVPTINKFMTGG